MKKTILTFCLIVAAMSGTAHARRYLGPDPFAGFDDIFNQMFGMPSRGQFMIAMPSGAVAGRSSISIDRYQEGSEVVIKADVPGAELDDISVKIDYDNSVVMLNVTTHNQKRQEQRGHRDDGVFEMRSWSSSSESHSRNIPVEQPIDRTRKVSSTLKNGVLAIRVPVLTEQSEPKSNIETISIMDGAEVNA